MSRFFMHFWSDELCDVHYRAGFSGSPIEFTAGDGFVRAGIQPGDVVYIISVYDGQVMLIGRMTVGKVLTSYSEAVAMIAPEVEEAPEYLLAAEGIATEQYFTRQLMMEEAGDLRLLTADGSTKPLKFADDEEVDEHALTGVHEIAPASAIILDQVLSQPFHDQHPDTEDGDDEDEIDDADLAAISRSFGDEDTNRRVQSAAMDFVVGAFEEKGWTVMPVDDPEEGYDLQCTVGDDHLHVVVKGNANDALEFMLTELEYARAERDGHFALCLVSGALSGSPSLTTFSGDDLYDLFDARPVKWAFRYRDEEASDTEDF
ncbi:MAG: DUF3883 domain-containing protein [Bacteroidetes bacterium]|nr:DUF3883 domain-containing protein [Bacteroidota bacterium]